MFCNTIFLGVGSEMGVEGRGVRGGRGSIQVSPFWATKHCNTGSILIRTQNFQIKLFDIAVTLKYGQGHQKWYEQVKLSE